MNGGLGVRLHPASQRRMRATQPGNVPGEMDARYYAQRASAGCLLIAEGTQISKAGQGYPATPGIHSPEQVAGWRLVTNSAWLATSARMASAPPKASAAARSFW